MHLRAQGLTDVAVVIVHYHAPALVADALAALRRSSPGGAGGLEVVVVDNGSDADEAGALRALDVPVLGRGENLGYAGGANLGIARTTAPLLVVMNPDVLVAPGCLDILCGELRQGAAAAGPRFTWDAGGRLLLPPAERRDPVSASLGRLAGRSQRWALRARRRWRRHARRHWTAAGALTSHALSGALLAMRRDAFDAVGPFDEGYRLYFEETDWLGRLARRGGSARYVPAARAQHLYDRSARHEPAASAWFADSARRFERTHLRGWAGWLRWLGRLSRPSIDETAGDGADLSPVVDPPALDVAETGWWVEVSPAASGYPAAAERVSSAGRWTFPADAWAGLAPGRYGLRLVDAAGRERETRQVRR
jgi:N-acetylglucosaminyl-diphospho-decaprenol L-rhamnosyltransferase